MGVTTRDIFGTPTGGEPAAPGSYGERPEGYRLPDASRLGPVRLQVSDLERSLAYYEGVLGFRTVQRGPDEARLAASGDDRVLVELHAHGAGAPVHGRRLGLYHFAILVPDRAALGRLLLHLSEHRIEVGAADHLVSEALYLTDPDGLGIEVYADRPRTAWRRRGRELMMATDPLDAPGLARAAGGEGWSGMPAGTTIGHVHLHVGDIDAASGFYADALGFDRVVWSYPGALFLAAGGYHHHLGTNTWAGSSARAPGPDEPQLLEWTIELPDPHSVAEAAASLARAGHPVEHAPDGSVSARDPWGTAVRLRAA